MLCANTSDGGFKDSRSEGNKVSHTVDDISPALPVVRNIP